MDTRVVAEVRQRLVRGRLETVRLNLVPGRVFVAEPPLGVGWDLFRDVGIIRFLGADTTLGGRRTWTRRRQHTRPWTLFCLDMGQRLDLELREAA